MIRKFFAVSCLLLAIASNSTAYTIDDFEDGLLKNKPSWFSFDKISLRAVSTRDLRDGESDKIGAYALLVGGATKDWYVGGIGVVLGLDAASARSFNLDIYGYGEGSGKIKVELYDGNKNNTEIETKDDLWVKELEINWYGWRQVSFPLSEFKNMGTKKNRSGELAKLQLIFISTTQMGGINCALDNLRVD
ncbi:hypothetical protein A2276_07045 [candidate division WOR-1 bacterium RIFOXYA12_FULL_43_27]|uniref:CBM11 domain-containing protein n=1 Tax=candidate division WOR-1 bacterium RIFOXYC2_FULL_46_14 TaxID=1802587 RepID=A0A1F4U309_UNCSA|nr:MAG: hypothetical protein A2276_07045 [candidate division WOR-1 bacterium RIFOXYA12_FULL_43_27]OGC18842.1 MAG: hypothetical protein A2292_07900 [candidate division WOR-1 bacterium RIFOXYB2_FULL_46_45]OGC28983.1 MAG: hypothetical protein A2232_02965 [candidate division WOR-1 bacterium RIFOXYA2_FULL_46_56]OGC39365.1 MAG: hypothetical protein A2438_06580 [candidate division WOR-1 bacterium RIFOXYC2_FULL_46_14]